MNIWVLNHYANAPDRPGGTRHYDLATELVRLGCQVTIFASAFSHHTKKDERAQECRSGQPQVINGVRFVWIRTFSYRENNWRRAVNMVSYSLRAALVGFRLKPSPDVILASSPHPLAGLCGYALARVSPAGFIYEVRDLWPRGLVDVKGYSRKSFAVRVLGVLERFLYRSADKIVVLLPRASDHITRLGIPANKIVYIPNGANPTLSLNSHRNLPEELSRLLSRVKATDRLIVGYVGTHGTANALEPVLQAICLLQDRGVNRMHFVFVGDGPEKGALMATAQKRGLKNVTFADPIPKCAVPEFLRCADIGIISMWRSPLYDYGMSLNKLWDYMMSSRPVVWASNVADNPVAEAGCGLTAPPEEPDKLADAIVEMGNMTEEGRREMGMRGHQYVMEYHSTPVLAARLLAVLQEVKNERH